MTTEFDGRKVSAVLLCFNRREWVEVTLDELALLPVDEIVIVDHGDDGTADLGRSQGARVIEVGRNGGIAGRNVGARAASGDLLLMLDDDAYPLPGAIESLVATFDRVPHAAVVGGFVRDVDSKGNVLKATNPGDFDWFLRAGQPGAPEEGLPSFFFPEGACMVRRDAFLDVGGYFEPFFFEVTELELTTRLIAAGYEVRYQPMALFNHMKATASRSREKEIYLRTRNDAWYFLMYFGPLRAAVRMIAYSFFGLIEAIYAGHPRAWVGGLREAWSRRRVALEARRPLGPSQRKRAEMNRGRLHMKLYWEQLKKRLRRRP